MYGRKGRGFGRFGGGHGWGRGGWGGRWGWGRGPRVVDVPPEEERWARPRGSDVMGTPPPWAGFWGGREPRMTVEERKHWLRAWRDHLKVRLAEVEDELRRLGE